MNIADNILREEYSYRGGGCELDLTPYGYEGHKMSAYQNYLGGGMLGGIGNDCTISNWMNVTELLQLALELKEYYLENSYHDEYNVDFEERELSAY